ncbi:hypothetical protein [Acidianus brierleyi]|uniref:hypothetical protein n=1 Tax=Acidianus brierleyi TaxID=41673 RepID=UPI0013A57CC9|nr:hypothetical protein [Acidianus brierleyi]
MQKYFTILKTNHCKTNYGLFECKIEDGKENCKLIACVVPRENEELSLYTNI